MEYRFIERAGALKGENGKLSGRAAPFNTQTMIGKKPWGFREKIAPGAFAKSINDGDVVLLDNHQTHKPIARQSAGTLKLKETKGGLDWDADPANTSYANDAVENARAGNFGGCSFGFEVVRDSWHYNKDDDVDERTLHEVKLHEISVVTFPAYTEGTSVSARDQVEAAMEARKVFLKREYFELYVKGGVDPDEDDDRGGDAPGNGKKPYGNVTYADPGYQKDKKKRYPIDSKAHAKSAWSYINKASNGSAYTASQLASIKSKIKAALKKFGVKVSKNSKDINMTKRGAFDEGVYSPTIHSEVRKELVEILSDVKANADDRCTRALAVLANDTVHIDVLEKHVRKVVEKAVRDTNKVGTSSQTDGDEDDPICDACHGSGKFDGGPAHCPGCGGTGRVAGGGDTHDGSHDTGDTGGSHKGSDFGLGVAGEGDSHDQNSSAGVHEGTVPGTPAAKGDAPIGNDGAEWNSNDPDGETRKDGQPDTSTDQDEDDATRWLKAKALQRRMQFESE